MKLKIYVAGVISGGKPEDVWAYFDNMSLRFKMFGYDVFSPTTGKGMLRTETEFRAHGYDIPVATNHAIIERDRWMVKHSDVIFCDLSGKDAVSIGCTAELAWAHDNGVHSVVVLPEEHPMRHAFILEMADVLFTNREEAIEYIKELAS